MKSPIALILVAATSLVTCNHQTLAQGLENGCTDRVALGTSNYGSHPTLIGFEANTIPNLNQLIYDAFLLAWISQRESLDGPMILGGIVVGNPADLPGEHTNNWAGTSNVFLWMTTANSRNDGTTVVGYLYSDTSLGNDLVGVVNNSSVNGAITLVESCGTDAVAFANSKFRSDSILIEFEGDTIPNLNQLIYDAVLLDWIFQRERLDGPMILGGIVVGNPADLPDEPKKSWAGISQRATWTGPMDAIITSGGHENLKTHDDRSYHRLDP